jgi:hypothetical protein
MFAQVLKQESEELFDLEYLAHANVDEERDAVVLAFPIQPAGMMSVDEKLYQRFGEEFEAPAYENLFEEDFTPTKEVLER